MEQFFDAIATRTPLQLRSSKKAAATLLLQKMLMLGDLVGRMPYLLNRIDLEASCAVRSVRTMQILFGRRASTTFPANPFL